MSYIFHIHQYIIKNDTVEKAIKNNYDFVDNKGKIYTNPTMKKYRKDLESITSFRRWKNYEKGIMLTIKIKKKWQSWIEKKENNTWEIIVIKEKICWIVQLIMLKKQKAFALVSKFRNYSKFFKFGKYRQIWKANVFEISKFEISKKVFEF